MELQDEFYSNAEYIETVCVVKHYVKTQFELSRLYRFTGEKTQKLTVNVRQLQFFHLLNFYYRHLEIK